MSKSTVKVKHTYLLNIKRDVKTVYLVVSSITDLNLVRSPSHSSCE